MTHLRLLRIFSVSVALTMGTNYLHAAALTASATTINLTCTMGATCSSSGTSDISIASGTGYFTVTPPSVPWLEVTPMAGTATTTATDNVLTFTVSPGWTTLGAGLASTTVSIVSPGNTGTSVTVTLEIQSAASTLTIKGGINVLNPIAYTAGAAAPSMSLTVLSSTGLPLPFTVSASGNTTPEGITSWLTSGVSSGIAYSWGTTISFSASAQATQQNAQPGDILTGQITITPAGQSAVVVPVSINVSAGTPTLTGVSPNIVPLLASGVAPGFVTLVLKGTNFVSTTGIQQTKVFVGANLAGATQVATQYVNVLSSNYLTVQIPYSTSGVPFATAGTTAVLVGVANGANPTAPVATQTIGVTAAPIIYGITSASAFVDAAAGTNPKVAPYDIISIFGANFCVLCTGTNSVLVGAPDPVYGRFPTYLSPDGTHKISVLYSKPGAATTNLPGYLLFATSTQINVLVPGAVSTLNSSGVNVQVGYDTNVPASSTNSSAVFLTTYATVDPGVFTIASNGQGPGAITDAVTFALNTSTAPTTPYSSSCTGCTIAIFMTGLGTPDSSGADAVDSSPTYGTNCVAPLGVAGTSSVAPTGYMGAVNTPFFASVSLTGWSAPSGYVVPNWTSIDGAVIEASYLQGNYAPCFVTAVPTVTIGGVAATVTSASFVQGSIAGLYQVNVQVPTPNGYDQGVATEFPVVVTQGSVASQVGVTVWID
jgi:uncharacterized protein (TIGR03437 family)